MTLAGPTCASVADFGKLAQVLIDLADRNPAKQAAAKAPEMPKTFLESMTLLLTAVSMGAYRDGLIAVSSHIANVSSLPELVVVANGLIVEVNTSMHAAFARQSSADTVGFAHMLVRYLGQLPPAAGGFSCAPLTSESQQMAVTFLRECLARHQSGVDLLHLTQESLASDLSTAVTRELVSRSNQAAHAGGAHKKVKPNPYVPRNNPHADHAIPDGNCRDFARGACGRGALCRFAHGQLALPAPPLGVPFQRPAGRGRG
jgi:hypothetical protein